MTLRAALQPIIPTLKTRVLFWVSYTSSHGFGAIFFVSNERPDLAIQDLVIQDVIAIFVNIFYQIADCTILSIVCFQEYIFHFSLVWDASEISQRNFILEQTCRDFLKDNFEGNFQ